jgi:hypothetical protein
MKNLKSQYQRLFESAGPSSNDGGLIKEQNESAIKSDIMTKWTDANSNPMTTTIEEDLVNFVDEAYATGGEDSVESLAYVFRGMAEYIEAGQYIEGQD